MNKIVTIVDRATVVRMKIMQWIDANIDRYLTNEIDYEISNGNVALCIIEPNGDMHGKMYGKDKYRKQNSFQIAWEKAKQVWLTGISTGEFEIKNYKQEINELKFQLNNPDTDGCIGGKPIYVNDTDFLSIGYSGFREETGLQLINDAIQAIGLKTSIHKQLTV
jgi:uncharacterized protein GlcG (DUF336 family)